MEFYQVCKDLAERYKKETTLQVKYLDVFISFAAATAFLQASPIFVVFLSFFTRSKPSLFVSLATIIGFVGVLLIANPSTSSIPLINAILGIFGIPYQFMPHVDPRIDASRAGSGAYLTLYSSPGREYAHHIVSDMPILFLSPGLPNFAATFGDEDKVTIGTIMTDIASGLGGTASTEDLLQQQSTSGPLDQTRAG